MPRLELLAAELSVKVRMIAIKSVKLKIIRVTHWTDSTTVLYWIHDDSKRFQKFVHNKLINIRQATTLEEWRYVPTKENPADLPSRGTHLSSLVEDELWFYGPKFLQLPEENWPQIPSLKIDGRVASEMKKEERIFKTSPPSQQILIIPWEKFGTWQKLMKTAHLIMSWRDRARHKLELPPLAAPWKRALWAIIRQVQIPFHALGTFKDKHETKLSGFVSLLPRLDESGLWRGVGRLSHVTSLPLDEREPLLLPRDSPAIPLLVRHVHEKRAFHYGGVNYTLSLLLKTFWTPRARQLVKSILTSCTICRRRVITRSRPIQGKLPEFRLLPQSPEALAFSQAAVDCAGPFHVKRKRTHDNCYLLLMTCCQIRAVKLELLTDLSVDAFLMALTRLASRGANPTDILSDNGGNFEGTNNLLQSLWNAAPKDILTKRAPHINWRFNPPYASHYGGLFERLIKATKDALMHALPTHCTYTKEELTTTFATVEGILEGGAEGAGGEERREDSRIRVKILGTN